MHNKRDTLAETVASALRQSFADFELILIDDGSTDGSLETIGGVSDPRLRILSQANAGPGAARNRGAAAARHEWIAFLDADDIWFDDHLAELAAVRRACPEAALIGAGHRTVSAGCVPGAAPRPPGRIGQVCYFEAVGRGEDVLHTSSTALRRSVWSETGGFALYPSGEDAEYWVRIALRWPVARSTRTTVLYLTGTGGIIDARKARRIGRPPAMLADLSPAVARLLEAYPSIESPRLRRGADSYIDRYLRWRLDEAAYAGDARTVSALARMAPRRLPALDRLLVAPSRLPAPVAAAAYRAIRLVRALGRRLCVPKRWFRPG